MSHVHIHVAGVQWFAQERHRRDSQCETDCSVHCSVDQRIRSAGNGSGLELLLRLIRHCNSSIRDRVCHLFFAPLDCVSKIRAILLGRGLSSGGCPMFCCDSVDSVVAKATGYAHKMARSIVESRRGPPCHNELSAVPEQYPYSIQTHTTPSLGLVPRHPIRQCNRD